MGETVQAAFPPSQGDTEGRTYSIGDLAQEFGLTARTIRFYEDQGLLSPDRQGQARIYSYRDRARLRLICRGKRLGFSLAEIGEFLGLYSVDNDQAEQMRYMLEKARKRIASLEQQLRDVEQTLKELGTIEQAIVDHLKSRGIEPDSDQG